MQTAAPIGDKEKPSIVLQLDYTSHRSWVSLGCSYLQLEESLGWADDDILNREDPYFTLGTVGGILLERFCTLGAFGGTRWGLLRCCFRPSALTEMVAAV